MSVIRHTRCDSCGSSDANAIYANNGGSHCFSCGSTVPSKEYIEAKDTKINKLVKRKENMQDRTEKNEKFKPCITQEENEEIKARTSASAKGYRGITDDTLRSFGVRTEFNEETGDVFATYYPCTEGGKLSGYKPRIHPKKFGGSTGRVGASCDLFGQFKFKTGGKTVLIVGGEHDALAAYQMLQEYYKSKNWDFDTPVVSPTVGEGGSSKQIANNYTFFDSFDKIILGFDQDEAGIEATEKVVASLPKGKVFIAKWSKKDPNEMLLAGVQRQFISDFYDAKAYIPAGVLGSSELYDKLLEQANRERIPFPPFMKKLEKMLGSFELQTCGVIAAGTGAAKTTISNEIIYHLLFNTSYKVGVVSLELDGGQYAQALLSRHIQNRISSIDDVGERMKYLKSDQIKAKADELFKTESGADRFMVLDERDFSIETMKDKILEMVISGGCQIIILDPVSDLFEGETHDVAASFMKFLKSTMKSYPVSFLLLAHIRKSSTNKDAASSGAFVPEEAIFGSGALTKSAAWVAMLSRDKYNESSIIRNTTKVVLSKNRRGSTTGAAGEIYYCSDTHKMYDLDEYLQEHGGIPNF